MVSFPEWVYINKDQISEATMGHVIYQNHEHLGIISNIKTKTELSRKNIKVLAFKSILSMITFEIIIKKK